MKHALWLILTNLLENTSERAVHSHAVYACMYSVTLISLLSTIWPDHDMLATQSGLQNQYGWCVAWWKDWAWKELCVGNWRMLRINVCSIGCADHSVLCWWINDEEEEGPVLLSLSALDSFVCVCVFGVCVCRTDRIAVPVGFTVSPGTFHVNDNILWGLQYFFSLIYKN